MHPSPLSPIHANRDPEAPLYLASTSFSAQATSTQGLQQSQLFQDLYHTPSFGPQQYSQQPHRRPLPHPLFGVDVDPQVREVEDTEENPAFEYEEQGLKHYTYSHQEGEYQQGRCPRQVHLSSPYMFMTMLNIQCSNRRKIPSPHGPISKT